jgi:hypothetical protein
MPTEKLISFHIEKQFPAIYREEGQELVQFVKEYYKFLETNSSQSLYNGRRIFEYRDIDTTLERMLLFFKKKYLADLPFNDDTVRLVVKNILGLYRRKGTQDGLELFFRLFYEETIKVYYPARDMLRPSDSEWKSGDYLELRPNSGIFTSPQSDLTYTYNDIIGKRIVGQASRASAVVDKINFITINNTILPIIFVNNVTSEFIKLEQIVCDMDGVPVNFGSINGSLSAIQINENFEQATLQNEVGDMITFQTLRGNGGKGIVTDVTASFTGIVRYTVEDGGWGYSIDSTRLLVSNQIVFYQEGQVIDVIQNEPIEDQDGNMGSIIDKNSVAIGIKADEVSEFTANSIIRTTNRDALSSFKIAANTDLIITLSEAIERAASNIEPEKTLFEVIVSGSRKLGDIDNDGSITSQDVTELNRYLNGTQVDQTIISYIENEFKDYLEANTAYEEYPAYGFQFISVVAKNDTSPGDLFPDTANTGDVVVSSLTNTETVSLIFDVIGNYTNVTLNANNYNDTPAVLPMSGNTDPVDINTTLDSAFDLTPVELGSIVGFNNINPGFDYVNDVFAIAEDSRIIPFSRKNQLITLEDIPGTLNVGDEITQDGIKGKVLRIQDKTITVRPYTYFGFNSDDPILFGGTLFNIDRISLDFGEEISGKNATISSTTDFGVGKITQIDIIDSGYGYSDRGIVNVIGMNGNVIGQGTVLLGGLGSTQGFWASLDSHLNGYVRTLANDGVDEYFESNKRIQDSEYYQEYSYEIQSKIDISTYEESLKETAHVAGTKMFGKFNLEEEMFTPISSILEINI